MLRKLFALRYLQVDQPIKIRDRDELNDNVVYYLFIRDFKFRKAYTIQITPSSNLISEIQNCGT